MDEHELARLDYEQTTQLVRALTEIRFRLLAFVPTIAGAAVAFLSDGDEPERLLAVGLLGLAATLGVYVYELRNTQLYRAAVARARVLEQRLGFRATRTEDGVGGVFGEEPPAPVRLWGLVDARHGLGLGLVYGAALAGWGYLVGWGAVAAVGVGGGRIVGGIAGLALGALVVATTDRG